MTESVHFGGFFLFFFFFFFFFVRFFFCLFGFLFNKVFFSYFFVYRILDSMKISNNPTWREYGVAALAHSSTILQQTAALRDIMNSPSVWQSDFLHRLPELAEKIAAIAATSIDPLARYILSCGWFAADFSEELANHVADKDRSAFNHIVHDCESSIKNTKESLVTGNTAAKILEKISQMLAEKNDAEAGEFAVRVSLAFNDIADSGITNAEWRIVNVYFDTLATIRSRVHTAADSELLQSVAYGNALFTPNLVAGDGVSMNQQVFAKSELAKLNTHYTTIAQNANLLPPPESAPPMSATTTSEPSPPAPAPPATAAEMPPPPPTVAPPSAAAAKKGTSASQRQASVAAQARIALQLRDEHDNESDSSDTTNTTMHHPDLVARALDGFPALIGEVKPLGENIEEDSRRIVNFLARSEALRTANAQPQRTMYGVQCNGLHVTVTVATAVHKAAPRIYQTLYGIDLQQCSLPAAANHLATMWGIYDEIRRPVGADVVASISPPVPPPQLKKKKKKKTKTSKK
jgi:hypothetical protein